LKNKTLLICICLLFAFFILTGCRNGSDRVATSESVTSNNSEVSNTDQNSEQNDTTSLSPIDTEDAPLVLITSNSETYTPFVNSIWSSTWTGEGWVEADYLPLINKRSEVAHELPVIIYNNDFSVDLGKNVTFQWLSIFNDSFEPVHDNADLSLLKELHEGTYYIILVVNKQGKLIKTENEHEASGYECTFSLVVK